ncbi:hypothetical protein SLEP1_g3414 [Rubroshorea leprosula]|uniref:phospholipase D n=1 Tax=Rubroshorea leprosula TaxID=152421 RepID=A0AAV5HR12_9ROSI|nr:hypothetical protein SLEP1_g3414 [Rubroshorea leprosula]
MAENSANPLILLHGDLELEISEARALPDLSRLNRLLNSLRVGSHGDQERQQHVRRRPINAYVTVSVPEATVARTRVIENAINPQWGEKFFVFLCHPVENLEFKLKVVKKTNGAKVKGKVKISAQRIATGELISEYFPLIRQNGKQYRDCTLKIEIKFTPFDKNPLYGQSIPSDPEHAGVRHTYFPLRKGCELRLYQDAHVPNGILPEIEQEDRRVFLQHNCFEDICFAIAEAQRLIYIAGWSVFCKIRLVREPSRPLPGGANLTLGQLLKYKSEEGVRVLLLIWEDQPSCDKFGITSGVMQTHDEETKRFFEGSYVTCVLTPRCASKKLSLMKQLVLRTMFSNHQKCILVDTQAVGNYRKITAFLGGFDLSDGRYDTPEHRLFRDLDTVFKDDFRNRTLPDLASILVKHLV